MEESLRELPPEETANTEVEVLAIDKEIRKSETDIDKTIAEQIKKDFVKMDSKLIIEPSEDSKNDDVSRKNGDIKGESEKSVEIERDEETLFVIKDDRVSDSDINSDEPSSNADQIKTNASSQFYESSDSKVDYAVKSEDNDTLSDIEDIKTDSACADSEDSALGSLPSDPDPSTNDREEEGQDRSDGSDSGLGSETTEEVKTTNFGLEPCTSDKDETKDNVPESLMPTDCETSKADSNEAISSKVDLMAEPILKAPLKSSLKRKLEIESEDEPQPKQKKHGIQFEKVRVYYFPRSQGFSCVPSQGGSTLGMDWKHSHMQDFSIVEHAAEQRRLHRQLLQQIKSERHSLEGVGSSSDDSDTEEDGSDISESELDLDSYYFLQPVPTRQRRALLRAAGVRKIEGYEKDECRDIRTSREFCGCACKLECDPSTCSCSLSGIKCQVDRLNFPCGCTGAGCKNTTGRIEFNPVRVRTHFIHTLLRVGLEQKHEEAQAAFNQRWGPVIQTTTGAMPTCLTNVAYDRNCLQNPQPNNIQEQGHYRYMCEDGSFRNPTEALQTSEQTKIVNHVNPYTANILQGKGPPYTTPGNIVNYDAITHNNQRFPCDLNYYQHNEHHQFKHLQSFPASNFEEFVHNHNSHVSMFNNYGQMYSSNFLQKQNPITHHGLNSLPYQQAAQTHYNMYTNNLAVANASKVEGYYAPMTPMPYKSDNIQSEENDENWFSHNTLMSLDQEQASVQAAPDAASAASEESIDVANEVAIEAVAAVAPTDTPNSTEANVEPTEDFGELIKKTMVESVSV